MVELIKGLAQVRDGLTLIAFLALVLLMALRTKQVSELLFGLLRDKLTRQEFARLSHRFMVFGFAAFLTLAALAALSQVLGHLTRPNALTVDDLRRELAKVTAPDDRKIHAEAQYNLGLDRLTEHDFNGAIESLRQSIQTIPTLTAQETLIHLYRQKHDLAAASAAWEEAVKFAKQRDDTLALVRLGNHAVPGEPSDVEGDHDLIGTSEPLPRGGDKYETATALAPGFYSQSCVEKGGCCSAWYKVALKTGQRLDVKFRTLASGGGLAGFWIYGTNGETLGGKGDGCGAMRGNAAPGASLYQLGLIAPAGGWYFLYPSADPGTVFRIRVQ